MASPASVGSSLFDTLGNVFIGEREAVKLAFDQGGAVISETTSPHNTLATAQPVTLTGLSVPDTLKNGFDAGKVFSVAATDVINASLQATAAGTLESDFYSFAGQAGDLMNLEVYSTSLTRIDKSTDPNVRSVDTELVVYDPSGKIVGYYGGQAFSDDDFESADPVLFDLKLPSSGTYTVEVRPFNASAQPGNYELFMYRFQAGNATPAGGSSDHFIVGPGSATFVGRGANDTVIDSGASHYTLANGSLAGTGTATLQNIAQASLTGATSGTTFDVSNWTGSATLTGVGGTNTVVLNLGSRPGDFTLTGNTLSVSTGGTFTLVNIQNVILTASTGGSRFIVNGWTGGASLIGGQGTDAVDVTEATSRMTITSQQLVMAGVGTFQLQSIDSAKLTGATAGTVFDVRGWSAPITLNVLGGANPVTNPRGLPLSVFEGSTALVSTASLTDLGTTPAGNYATTVVWGDGSSTAGTVSTAGSTITAQGSHPYEEGSFTTTTTLSQGNAFSVIVGSTATVTDAPLTVTQTAATASMGIDVGSAPLVTFVDANSSAPLSDFTATINWGDGTTATAGVIKQTGAVGSPFTVSGSHVYTTAISETVKVTISDVGGSTTTATFTLVVAPSIILLNPTASGALTIKGTTNINVGGAVVVDSNSSTALSASGGATVTASKVLVVGGASISNGAVVTPAPVTGATAIADPLANLPIPSVSGTATSVNLSKGSLTINPGRYSSIKVSGNGTVLTMNPGVYVITGGGFSVSNAASVSGNGVLIYNAGSSYPNAGGSFAAVSLGSSGTVNLSAPTTGTYAGVLIFQSRDNTLALSMNAGSSVGLNGAIYAANALVTLSGSAQFKVAVVANQLLLSGNSGSTLTTSDAGGSVSATAGQLLGADLTVYVDQSATAFTADEQARLNDALSGLSVLLAPYNIQVGLVSDPSLARVVVQEASTTVAGDQSAGVLALFTQNDTGGVIQVVSGWNWYTQADASAVGASQYDFETVLLHELGHALGLGHRDDPTSVMYATLPTGVAKRALTTADLEIPELDGGPHALMAANFQRTLAGAAPTLGQATGALAQVSYSTLTPVAGGLALGTGNPLSVALPTPSGPVGAFRGADTNGRRVPQGRALGSVNLSLALRDQALGARRDWEVPLEFPITEGSTGSTLRGEASEAGAETTRPVASDRDVMLAPRVDDRSGADHAAPPSDGSGDLQPQCGSVVAVLALVLGLPRHLRFLRRGQERKSMLNPSLEQNVKNRRLPN
jgi:hypothetical protein